MPNLTDYDPDCAEAAAELWSQLTNHEGEDADAQITICRAFKEYACEHDKRITSDEWAQKYREACEKLGAMDEAMVALHTAANRVSELYSSQYIRGNGDGGRASHAIKQLNEALRSVSASRA